MYTAIKKLSLLFNNVSDAFSGTYVSRDEHGNSFKDIYKNTKYPIGKEGAKQDIQNLAKDMSEAIKKHGKTKKTTTG